VRFRRTHRIEPSRLDPRDLVSEALVGVLQRPARSVLTMLGTVLGVGGFVAILGLTATAGGQIDKRFSVLSATEVRVDDVGSGAEADSRVSFPDDAAHRVERLSGVTHAGVWWPIPLRNPTIGASPAAADTDIANALTFVAASPEALTAAHPVMRAGRTYDRFHESRGERVAVLGSAAAQRIGIVQLDRHPAVFINGSPYTVIGIIADVRRNADLLLSIIIPTTTALHDYGPPTSPRASMMVETQLGAAHLIAGQVALALRPDAPQLFKVTAPTDPTTLRGNVTGDLNSLFLVLAAITLAVGAVGIANTTLVAVLERTAEIGLRRALGARPRHIALQFLTESTAIGTLGGLLGTSLGVAVVVLSALLHQWTAILQPWAVVAAPLVGALVGLVAGVYPALRAAWVEPVEALRR
jgi:putative ABC transport system permease protein